MPGAPAIAPVDAPVTVEADDGVMAPTPEAPQFAELPGPPPPPKLTGDPTKDVEANLLWQRALVEHHGALTKRQTEIQQHAANVGAMQSGKELEHVQAQAKAREAEVTRFAQEREKRQAGIDAAIAERNDAAKGVEGFNWRQGFTGPAIVAAIAGGIGQAFQNMAAAQVGHVGNAENEALKTINRLTQLEYKGREERLQRASNAVLEARYGHKDAAENHRMALNDLDADFAARWKAIGKEAEGEIRRLGGDEAVVKGSALIAAAAEKQAEHEGSIHEREEGRAEQRRHALATEANARAAIEARKKKARGGGGPGGAPSLDEQNKMATLSGKVDGIVQKVIQNTGYKESAVQNQKYNQIAAALAGAKDNAALAAAGAGSWVKMAQGGTGVISDNDMKVFWGKIGGVQDRVENYVETALSGKMGAAKQKIVADAVRQLARSAHDEIKGIGRQIETRLNGEAASIPWVKDRIPVYLDTYVPGLKPKAAQASHDNVPASDLDQMEAARKAGDHRFDAILKKNGR